MKETIFEMYKNISVGRSAICQECNKDGELDFPLSIYFVGEKFHPSADTVLFVGKTAVGGEGIGAFINDSFYDTTDFGEKSLDGNAHKSSFYSYTNEIIETYYGSYEEGKKFTALTNLVKCNNGSTKDETTYVIKEHCINHLKVIWREVEILKPKRIIFYTGRDYDDFIDAFIPDNFCSYNDIEDNEQECWWHRQFVNKDNITVCDILRVYHPDYMRYVGGQAKENYISKIVDWLQRTK
jgi:hypothetical protein